MAGRFYLVLFVLFRINIEATEDLSLFQIRARLQPRDQNSRQFAPGQVPGILSSEQYESAAIKELSQIRQRGLSRGGRGLRKYPMCFDEPVDNSQWWERRDNMYLNRFPKMRKQWKLSPNGPAQVLYNEIIGWKPSFDSIQQSRVDAYIARLNEIKERGLKRGDHGLNRFPKRRNDGSQESKDAMYIYAPPKYPEGTHIWEEIHSWSEESSASKKQKETKKRLSEERQRMTEEFEHQAHNDASLYPQKRARQARSTPSASRSSAAPASRSSNIFSSDNSSPLAPNLESPDDLGPSSDDEAVNEDDLQELIQDLPDEIIDDEIINPLNGDWDSLLATCGFDPKLFHEEHIASSPPNSFEFILLPLLFASMFCSFFIIFFKQKLFQHEESFYVEL